MRNVVQSHSKEDDMIYLIRKGDKIVGSWHSETNANGSYL